MRPEEVCEKLKPIVGDKADKLLKLYLIEDYKGKSEIEEVINLIRIKNLNEQEILLPPPQNITGDYPLGDIKYNGSTQSQFLLRKRDLPRHMAVFGTTGSGKTNVCFLLIEKLIKDNLPFFVTDWKQNYRDLLNTESGKNIKVYTVGKDTAPFHFNPLIPPKGVNPQIYINKLIDVINHSHFVSYGVDHLLQNAINTVYKECGIYSEITKIPTFTDVFEVLKKTPARGRESLWKASAMRVLNDLTFGPVGEVFNKSQTINIESFLNQQIILELDALPQTTKTFLVEALLLQIYLYRINCRNRDEKLKHMLILEEAHHLLLKKHEQEENITDIFLREIRETGQGVCLLDQSPSLISNTALSNTNTLIAMQLKHKDDIYQVSKALLLKELDYFGMLKVGEAIVKTQEPQPFLVSFPLAKVQKGTVSDAAIRRHMKEEIKASVSPDSTPKTPEQSNSEENKEFRKTDKLNTQTVTDPEKTHPYTGSNTAHFQKSKTQTPQIDNADIQELSSEEKDFLKDIAAHPLSGVSSRYRRLDFSVEKGHQTKTSLIEKGILKPVSIPINTGKLLLLEPTTKGRAILHQTGIPFKNVKGGVLHEYWRMKTANHYKAKGYKVRYEYPIGNGKTVDLVIEKDNEKTAVEIETGKSDYMENIRKCSDFNKTIIVATSPQAEKQIKEKLTKENIERDNVKVSGTKEFA